MLVGLAVAPLPAQAQPPWARWLDQEVVKKIQITGYRRLGYHNHFVRGDREAFDQLEYSGLGNKTFTDTGQINLTGRKVFGVLNFQASILDDRLTDPQGQRFSINYAGKGFTADAGDIQGTLLNTNQFAGFSKSLRGVSVGYGSGRFQAKALRSEAKGSARTVSLNGNNSGGPYYLQVSQIVNGSESVSVDGVEKTLGVDYIMNYELGSITFVDQIIPPTSTIVVSFEAFGFNTQRGIIQGAGVSYDMGRAGRVGLTAMQQISRAGGALSQRLEKFQGFGDPSRAYVLQFEPLPGAAFTVRVDGVEQVLGVDYVFDQATTSIFYFTRFIPFTSDVDVLYTPRPTATADGDRENLGIDYRLPLGNAGRNGWLQLSQATGRLKSTANPMSGTARGARLDYRTGKLEFRGSVKDVPATFVTVETRGFNRNEKASDWSLTYKQDNRLKYSLMGTNSRIENRITRGSGNVEFVPSRFTLIQGAVTYTPSADATPWTLEHRRTQSSFNQQDTRLDTTSLSTSRRFGRLDLSLGLQRTNGVGPITTGTTTQRGTVDLNAVRFGAGYNPNDKTTLSARGSFSAIDANGRKGSGSDYSLAASYVPSSTWSFGAQYALSDSGSLATLGSFQSGFGFGYGGNGFSGGDPSNPITGVTNLTQWSLTAGFNPGDRMAVNAVVARSKSSGSISSNADTLTYGLGATFDFGRGIRFATSLDTSSTTFVDSPLTSRATNLDFFLDGNPPGRLSYRLGASLLLTGGNSEFRQNSHSYEASLSYRLARRQALAFAINSGRIRGYYPQDSTSFGLTYQYQIWQSLALNVSYRVRDVKNLDPALTSGAYRSGGFDLELAFNFGR